MERETVQLITAVGQKTVVIKQWLEEGESRPVEEFWASRAKVTTKEGADNSKLTEDDVEVKLDISSDPKAIYEYRDILMKAWVVSIDGVPYTQELGMKLRKEDFREVTAFITNKISEDQKKASPTETPTGNSSTSVEQQ